MQYGRCYQQDCNGKKVTAVAAHGRSRYSGRLATCIVCAARCHYEVLGVGATASADEIKSAFRKLALQLHPDVNTAPDATDKFKVVKQAYEVLSDPKQRQEYNQRRTRMARTRTHASSSSTARSQRYNAGSVVYDYGAAMDEDDIEDDPSQYPGFIGWYRSSGSWQSSWQANRKKQQARAREQHRQQQYALAVEALLDQLDKQTLQVVVQVFGTQLERLGSLEELMDLLSALEVLRAQGIRPDPNIFGGSRVRGRGRSTARSSTSRGRQTTGTNTRSSTSKGRSSSSTWHCGSTSHSRSDSQCRADQTQAGSTKPHSRQAAAGKQRTARRRGGKMPPFDEMGWEQLFETMEDKSNPRAAAAARAWATEYAAMGANPYLAADLQAFLTLEWLGEDWDAPFDVPLGRDSFSGRSGTVRSSSVDERKKYRSKVGSAKDYVRYSSDDDTDSEDGDVLQEASGWMALDILMEQADAWYMYGDDSEDID